MGEECLPDVCYFDLIFIVQAPNNKENVPDTKLRMPMPKLIFTHHALPITHHALFRSGRIAPIATNK